MAKFTSIITLVFVALVLFVALEAPNKVGAMNFGDDPSQDPTQRCLGPDCRTGEPVATGSGYRAPKSCMRPSGTLRGVCENDITCKDRCAKLQGARHGSCRNRKSCACFFSC